jgi:leucyl-tRNA synthetase
LERLLHQTIKQVTARIETHRFNTVISTLMEFTNALSERQAARDWQTGTFHKALETLMILLAPIAPHITEELWHLTGGQGSVHQQSWPVWDAELAKEEMLQVAVQVDGRLRAVIEIPANLPEDEARDLALAQDKVQPYLAGKQVAKVIVVPGKIVSIVTRKLE